MKKLLFSGLVGSLVLVLCTGAIAQSKYRKSGAAPTPAVAAPATTTSTTPAPIAKPSNTKATAQKNSGSQVASANNNIGSDTIKKAPSGPGSSRYRPGNNTPAAPSVSASNGNAGSGVATISYDTTIQGGFDAKPEISLRNNYAVDRSQVRDRKPLAYEDLREDDALYSQFVWREIDGREKINQSFMYPGKDNNGDQRFFSILLSAIKNDSVVAFSADNDRFTIPLTTNQVMALTGGALDTQEVADPITGVIDKVVTKKAKFSPDSVYTFRIKEQIVFDKEASRLFTRIIGIAPIAKQVAEGKSFARVLFWVYYPDLRPSLTKFEVYNPKNFSARMTWEELFESRFFSSNIIKTTLGNPGDKNLIALIKDPLYRLLEGENIKQKIFNYEQDLWQH
ncbi:MAG: gliding motility protein GldN [Sphingobacteriia bacterium]|nr:MAG: gliding motility protein GldN [Sphingobacteriia bacterium]